MSAQCATVARMPIPRRVTTLHRGDRARLEQLVRSRTTPQRIVERARIVLASADGLSNAAICDAVRVAPPTVTRWLNRYVEAGAEGLLTDLPRSGRPKVVTTDRADAIIARTLREAPPDGGTHWSGRLMARVTGLHQTTIARLWRDHGLKPHRT